MVKLINGRTPEEIKANLKQCSKVGGCAGCEHLGDLGCVEWNMRYALALIEHLESERDAAINCLQDESNCAGCKWDSEYNDPKSPCLFCKRGWEDETEDHYAYRGTEPPKEESNA